MNHPNKSDSRIGRRPLSRSLPVTSLVVAALVAISACGSSSPKGEETKTSTPHAVTTTTVAVTKPKLTFSDDPTVACAFNSPLTFPASVTSGPTGAENGPSPAAKLLDEGLSGPGRRLLDPTGKLTDWRLAVETPDTVLFLGSGGGAQAGIEYQFKDGQWSWLQNIPCTSMVVARPKLNPVAMNLDPGESVDPTSKQVHVQVTELTCSGEVQLSTSRLVGPQVHEDDDRVVISTAAIPNSGASSKSCVAANPLDVEVKLSKPLGTRELLNGNRYPYKPLN